MTISAKAILGLLFIFQILVAANFELAHDEAYYWLFSKHLAWGYFDHPPMVAAVIRLFSFLPESELSVRLGFILLQLLTLLVLGRLVDSRNKRLAWALFLCFPLASIGGILALPDTPLLFFSALFCLCLKRYLEQDRFANWVALALVIPLMLYAKYHGILLVFFTLLALPELFKRRSFYFITVTSVLLFLPHVWWQYVHDFVTLRYHFLERPGASFSWPRLMEYFGVQILLSGLFTGPVLWWVALRRRSPMPPFDRAMLFVFWGTILFFFISSFSKRVEANWTIFLVVPLISLCLGYFQSSHAGFRFLTAASLIIVLLARLILVLPPDWVRLKRANEFHGWAEWTTTISAKCGTASMLANTYQIASKLSYYGLTWVHAFNYLSRPNQFDLWALPPEYATGKVCYLTDNLSFEGEPITTPEGKKFVLVTKFTLAQLNELKSKSHVR